MTLSLCDQTVTQDMKLFSLQMIVVKLKSTVAPTSTTTTIMTTITTTTTASTTSKIATTQRTTAATNATTKPITTSLTTTSIVPIFLTAKVATRRATVLEKILPYTVLGNFMPYGTRRSTKIVPTTKRTTVPTTVTSTTSSTTTSTVTTTTTATTTTSTTASTTTSKKPDTTTSRKPTTPKPTTRRSKKTTTEATTFTVEDQLIDDFYFSKEYPLETTAASLVVPLTQNSQEEAGASAVPLTVWIEIADLGKDGSNQGNAFIVDGSPGGKNGGKKGGKAPVGRRIPISVQAAPDVAAVAGRAPARDALLKNPFAEAPEASADANSEEVDLVEEETFVEQGGENRDGPEEIERDEHPAKWYDAYSQAQESVAMGQSADGKWYERDRR